MVKSDPSIWAAGMAIKLPVHGRTLADPQKEKRHFKSSFKIFFSENQTEV
jgi:hypothetical protein